MDLWVLLDRSESMEGMVEERLAEWKKLLNESRPNPGGPGPFRGLCGGGFGAGSRGAGRLYGESETDPDEAGGGERVGLRGPEASGAGVGIYGWLLDGAAGGFGGPITAGGGALGLSFGAGGDDR